MIRDRLVLAICPSAARRLIVCLLVVPLLVSCAQPAETPEPVTIRHAIQSDGTEYYQELRDQFQKAHPHITVELGPLGSRELASLDPREYDVLGPHMLFDELRNRGDLMSLDALIEGDQDAKLSDIYPGLLDLFTVQDKIWALPTGAQCQVMYFNADLFDSHGIPYPEVGWTLDDFLGAALAVRDAEARVWGYVSPQPAYDAMLFVYTQGGQLYDDAENPTRTTFDDSLAIEALE